MEAAKRIRLTGARFEGGRLPIDSLVELERYQEVVRRLAESEWRRDHPGEDLPADFRSSVSLTIERIDEGSADIFLVPEQTALYAQYQAEAQDAVDASISAAYAGEHVPPLRTLSPPQEAEFRERLAEIGTTLSAGQSIELYVGSPDAVPVSITVESRKRAIDELILSDFLTIPRVTAGPEAAQSSTESLVGRITAVDADSTKFDLVTSTGKVHGWYRDNTALLEDLRSVLNSASEGPLTRITGELRFKDGEPHRFWRTDRVERLEFDDSRWGRRLAEFAALPSGWADGEGEQISSIALDAAQRVLRAIDQAGRQLPGLFPTPEGGVLMEWGRPSEVRSVEILPDGLFELFQLRSEEEAEVHWDTESATDAIRFAIGQVPQ